MKTQDAPPEKKRGKVAESDAPKPELSGAQKSINKFRRLARRILDVPRETVLREESRERKKRE